MITRPTVMEINISNFNNNVQKVKEKLQNGTSIMPIMKANAYGTYINTKLEIINQFPIIGVAIVDEGLQLRELGYKGDIFVLNQVAISEIEKIIQNDLIIGISSIDFLNELKNASKKIRVHLEIETGMGRTGIFPKDIDEFINNTDIKIEGIYTHLSSPDTDKDYTKKQLSIFKEVVEKIKKQIRSIKYVHVAASNAIIDYKEAHFNLVRPGMLLYGYPSSRGIEKRIELKPVAKLKSEITLLKEVEKGESIGYARTFKTTRKSKIATIPIGYADGVRRELSNNGHILVKNKKAPIVGNICMDSLMADVTDLENVKVGDHVYIWDNNQITLEDVANKCKTINYEILSTISSRVPRSFKM